MCKARIISIAVVLLFTGCRSLQGVSGDIAIELVAPSQEIALGEPIFLRLRIRNSGSIPLYIEQTRDIGPEALQISATNGDCFLVTRGQYFSTPIEDLHFMVAPLSPGDVLEIGTVAINDGVGLDVLLLRKIGVYEISASLASRGKPVVEGRGPVWRGLVKSESIRIRLRGPDSATLATRFKELEECLKSQACIGRSIFEYFRLVRSPEAAVILRSLLERYFDVDPRIAEAVANQGGEPDVEALELAAEKTEVPLLRDYFLNLANTVRVGSPCR